MALVNGMQLLIWVCILFFIPISKKDQKQLAFIWNRQQNIFTIFLWENVNSLSVIQSKVSYTIWTSYNSSDWPSACCIMLTGSSEKK